MGIRDGIAGAVVLLGLLVLISPTPRAEDKKDEPRWDHSFNGHEMWSMNVDSALAQAAKEGRPMLIDFYKFT